MSTYMIDAVKCQMYEYVHYDMQKHTNIPNSLHATQKVLSSTSYSRDCLQKHTPFL